MSQDILGPMNIKIITDENENHVFSSNAGSCFKSESTIQIANNAIQNRIIRFIT